MAVDSDHMNPADDRQWLAIRYVLDELSADEAAAFEAAMADDVSLCEAVSKAVQLCSGVAMACRTERSTAVAEPVVPVRPRRSRVTEISACACLSLILAVMFFIRPTRAPEVVADSSASEADVLATLVSDDLPPDSASEPEDDLSSEDSLSDLAAPEWLLSAIELDDALKESSEFPGQSPEDETDVF